MGAVPNVSRPPCITSTHAHSYDVFGLCPMVVLCALSLTAPGIFRKQVFKGLNESTGELFAVKQIELTHGSKEEMNTLETEIDLMKDLNHM